MPSFLDRSSSNLYGTSRRELLRRGGLLTMAGALPVAGSPASNATAAALKPGELYRSIGVTPVINARGTFTIITGSQSLPEVKKAMEEASHSYVQMDELMQGVSKKLAELTGADWGIITAGCCAALTHCTAASIVGTNPERMQRLPDLTGLKNEVIIPEYSRNVYDHAIRMLGVKIIEVADVNALQAAFNDRTAMVYILAGPGDEGPLGTKVICDVAKQHSVPVIVDAAAEILTFPNVHLQRGATAVAYSGGKCIRGPQAAGLLIGDKNLLQAAWANSAPHHAFGRSLKVGKEEIMGMLTAVEMWKKRDHDAEWKQWESWLNEISSSVTKVNGVDAKLYSAEEGLSNRSPRLSITWDATKLGITGQEVSKLLLDSEPRIVLGNAKGSRPDEMASSISITPYMMMPGDARVVAERLHKVLAQPPKVMEPEPLPQGTPPSVAGQWETLIEFDRGSATHTLILEQQESKVQGTHRGEFVSGDLSGAVAANLVRFRSAQKIQGTRLFYDFTGTVEGDKMSGTVGLGEYGSARWSAQRHHYQTPGGVIRPVKPA
jgi:uncharacterized pyridoxal phosphate-dependent enzyme